VDKGLAGIIESAQRKFAFGGTVRVGISVRIPPEAEYDEVVRTINRVSSIVGQEPEPLQQDNANEICFIDYMIRDQEYHFIHLLLTRRQYEQWKEGLQVDNPGRCQNSKAD
jgi:hypothetical protein